MGLDIRLLMSRVLVINANRLSQPNVVQRAAAPELNQASMSCAEGLVVGEFGRSWTRPDLGYSR